MLTATQADAASFDANLITSSNFSEDRRKLDHVTAMIGINSTDEEKECGIYRLNHIKRRDDDFSVGQVVYTASCLAMANPAVRSAN